MATKRSNPFGGKKAAPFGKKPKSGAAKKKVKRGKGGKFQKAK